MKLKLEKSKPYYAVIFTSNRSLNDSKEYEVMAERMVALASLQQGFLGIDSVRQNEGLGITVSYWQTLEDIRAWKQNSEHKVAQEFGRSDWYDSYRVRICLVEHEYSFTNACSDEKR